MTAARRMCFDHFVLVYDRRAGDEAEANLLIHDYPDAWANVYVDFDLGGADPVRRAGERSLVGFEWQHLPDLVPMTEGDRHMLAVGRENGVGDGRSEEHTSELQSLMRISYAVFCLKKKTHKLKQT